MQIKTMMKNVAVVISLFALAACNTDRNRSSQQLPHPSTSQTAGGDRIQNQNQLISQLEKLGKENTIYFDYNKYDISNRFMDVLNSHAVFLRSNANYKIIIEGHTDERGTSEYNIALGERRASSILTYLQGQGVPANQMDIVSYGKEKPAVPGHDESVYKQNRRAILVY